MSYLIFLAGNLFLVFSFDTAPRLVNQNPGSAPDQFIGPNLLTALHNVAGLPVMATAGVLSPVVVKDIANGGGVAPDLFIGKSPETITDFDLTDFFCA